MPSRARPSAVVTAEYGKFVRSIKRRIQASRTQAYRAVNREMINLYCGIGKEIVERQERHGWGKSVVEQLSADLRTEIPDQRGFSAQNLWFMRQLYLEYGQSQFSYSLLEKSPGASSRRVLREPLCDSR